MVPNRGYRRVEAASSVTLDGGNVAQQDRVIDASELADRPEQYVTCATRWSGIRIDSHQRAASSSVSAP